MSQRIIIETLKGVGLTERDSEVFLFLAKKGPVVARDMLKATGINKAQLYLSLRNLQRKGIVESTLEYPARFAAVSFEQVLDLFIKTKRDETQRIVESREAVLSHWKSLEMEENPAAMTSDKFMVIEGETYINSKTVLMVKNAKKQILFCAGNFGIIQAEKANLIETIIEQKVPFKILTNVSSKNLPIVEKAIKKMGTFAHKCKGRAVNLAETHFPRFILRDQDELIFLITAHEDTESKPNADTGLWTNNKALIAAFKTFFDQLWREGTEIQDKISELKTGRSPPETIFIRDAKEAYQRYLLLIGRVQKEIVLMTSAKGLQDLLRLKPILEGWRKNDVNVRIMAPITKGNESIVQELSRYCSIRHVQVNCLGEVVVDGKQLFQFKVASPHEESRLPSTLFGNSFYTNDFEYVMERRALLNDLWDSSVEAIENLKRSEARFRSLFESSFDPILLIKPGEVVLSANPAACRLFGMTEDEIKRTKREELIVMDERALSAMKERELTGKTHTELTFKRKDGSTFEAEVTSSLFTDGDGVVKTSLILRDVTERKKAEEELRKSEVWKATSSYTRNLIEASLDPLVTIDVGGKITDVNKATEDVTGYTRSALIGSEFSRYFTDSEKARTAYKRVFTESIVKDYPLEIKHKSGKVTDVIYNATIFRNQKGEVQGVVAAARDVTELKKAEKILNKQQRELNLILDSSPSIVFYKDRQGRFIQINNAFAEALMMPKEDFLGKTVFDLYSPEIAQKMTNDDLEVFKSRRPKLGIVEPYESPTGIRWIRTHKIPTFDEQGNASGLIGFSEEITEQKKAEDGLKESQRWYQNLIESTADFVYELDCHGRYTYCSPQMEKLWGFKPAEMIGKTPFDRMPEKDKDRVFALFKSFVASPKPLIGLITSSYDSKGRLRIVETSGVPFFDDHGKVIGYRGISRDITSRKKSEKTTANLQKSSEQSATETIPDEMAEQIDAPPLKAIENGVQLLKARIASMPEGKDKESIKES